MPVQASCCCAVGLSGALEIRGKDGVVENRPDHSPWLFLHQRLRHLHLLFLTLNLHPEDPLLFPGPMPIQGQQASPTLSLHTRPHILKLARFKEVRLDTVSVLYRDSDEATLNGVDARHHIPLRSGTTLAGAVHEA